MVVVHASFALSTCFTQDLSDILRYGFLDFNSMTGLNGGEKSLIHHRGLFGWLVVGILCLTYLRKLFKGALPRPVCG